MAIPQFMVTADTVGELTGDSDDVGSGLDVKLLAGLTFQFLSNLPDRTLLPIDGDMLIVRPVDAIVHTDGVLHRVVDGVMGEAGVPLLADGAVELAAGSTLQWKCVPGNIVVKGRTVKGRSWWFDARANGVTISLAELPPVIGAAATGTTRGPKGDGGIGGVAVENGDGTVSFASGAKAVSTADAAKARAAINAAPVLDLYVDDFAASGFTWGVDDTAPWQAAVDAAHTAGVATKIHARPGRVYKVNPLKVYSNTVLEGHGATLQVITRVGGTNVWDAVIYTAGCTPANGCTGDGVTVVSNVEIRDFIFDTQARAYTTIMAQNAKAIAVRLCSFPSNQTRIAIRFDQNTDQCVAEGNRIVSTLDTPFGTITNAQGISCASAAVDSTGGAYGLYGTGTVDVAAFTDPTNLSKRHKIINNWIEGGTHGVALFGADGCLVEGNTITDPSHRGVILSPVCYRNVIVGNVVRGQFSCAFLLAFGSKYNLVADNEAYCTNSVSEFNAFRASYGASDNMFSGNYAYGVTGAAFRAFTGAINNSFIGNKAENCGTGIEFLSLAVDTGYQQNINTPAMVGNSAQANHFIGCGVGINLRSGTTIAAGTTTPPTTAAVSIPLRNCTLIGNVVQGSTGNGARLIEDTAGSITAIVAAANAMIGNGSTDWQTPRANGHFTSFLANNGSGMMAVHLLPASGNSDEWRDSTGAIKAFIGSSGSMVTLGRRAAGSSVTSTVAVDYVNTTGASQIGRRMDGQTGQTADLDQWTINAGPNATVVAASRINNQGGFVTAVHAAPPDANLAAGDMAIWFDQTNGAAKLMVKAKQADGTVKTGSVALS